MIDTKNVVHVGGGAWSTPRTQMKRTEVPPGRFNREFKSKNTGFRTFRPSRQEREPVPHEHP